MSLRNIGAAMRKDGTMINDGSHEMLKTAVDRIASLETELKDAMEQSRASQKVLLIEQQKHLDTANWSLEQQERADTAENKVRKLEAVKEAAKVFLVDSPDATIEEHKLRDAIADLEDGE